MGRPAEQPRPRATYAELEGVPANKVAELIGGTLHVMPRPAPKHAHASTTLTGKLMDPFGNGIGGPGGWCLLDEPELHFPDPAAVGEIEALVPDIAGWRRARMPELPETAYFEVAPDWICEVLSRSTEEVDRDEKMPIYAREGVGHAWLVDPVARVVEVYVRGRGRRWEGSEVYRGAVRVRLAPFEAIEIDLGALWSLAVWPPK
jgi:Uma2 family endonuclease